MVEAPDQCWNRVGVQKLDGNEAQSSFSWTCVEDCGIDVEEEDEDSGGHPDTDRSLYMVE